MQITLNGQTLRLDAPLTVAELLKSQGMSGKRIAVERNGEIVPRGRHAETWIAPDDRLEVVVAVGGG
jgi:sulfur carrier protein